MGAIPLNPFGRRVAGPAERPLVVSMNLSGDVLFDYYDKAALKPVSEEAPKKVAVILSRFPESKVTVEGYTDSKGGPAANKRLADARRRL